MGQLLASGTYRPRIADAQIERYLRLFGAVEISGTKWCGKTWAAMAHGESITYVDRGANLQIVQADPAYALAGEHPHVIDEWQRVPQVWDTVRHAVDDAAGTKGLWILTGSSTPLNPGERSHSGAGRIGRIRMSPMTLSETGESGHLSASRPFSKESSPRVSAPMALSASLSLRAAADGPRRLSFRPTMRRLSCGNT